MVEVEVLTNKPTSDNVEKLKLFKNTKGYNWEIQLIGIDLKRMRELNQQMIEQYGDTGIE